MVSRSVRCADTRSRSRLAASGTLATIDRASSLSVYTPTPMLPTRTSTATAAPSARGMWPFAIAVTIGLRA